MSDFFNDWKRKAGCAALVVAAMLTYIWIRSLVIHDGNRFTVYDRQHAIISGDGNISWCSWDVDGWRLPDVRWISQTAYYGPFLPGNYNLEVESHHYVGTKGLQSWEVPYWCVVLPLLVVSAYLLLSKPPKHALAARHNGNSTSESDWNLQGPALGKPALIKSL